MATRTSARLAALSPPPSVLAPTNVTFTESRFGGVASSMAWTKRQLDEYRVEVVRTAELTSLLPSGEKDDVAAPEGLFTSEGGPEADFMIRAFFDNLEAIRGFGEEDGGESRNVEGFTRQLLFDFMRILVLANKESLRKGVNATVQMIPPGQRTFDTADAKYVVANDGSFGALANDDKKQKVVKNLPVSFETTLSQIDEEKAIGQVFAQLLASALESSKDIARDAFVFQLKATKVSIFHAQFSAEYLKQIQSGEKVSESASIHQYPREALDLENPTQRKELYDTIFSVLKHTISKTDLTSPPTPADSTPKRVIVINSSASDGERYLTRRLSRPRSPRRQSPRRTPSPKRTASPKRKLSPEEEAGLESPRPAKRTATTEIEEAKPVKKTFGFGASISGVSPWAVPPTPASPTLSQPLTLSQPPKKTFGFGAATTGVSPFAAAGQASSSWSGWDNQKPSVFEKKSLFGPSTPAPPAAKPTPPPKNSAAEEKKVDGSDEDEEEDSVSADENGGESGAEDDVDLESQLENGEDGEKPKKLVDMREQAGEAHEETLFETTCTLYETDPTSGTWVSKGTGIIHVNVEKNWTGKGQRASRLSTVSTIGDVDELVMRQQGTMKVMWNVRLFDGMTLFPRQVSDGDRRMDVYVKMVLVDNGLPKTYAIKLRNHVFMDQLYTAIEQAIPHKDNAIEA